MSIIEGLYDGRRVFADEGEELRGKDIRCLHCDAKMHVKLFPNQTEHYYFALQEGQLHKSVFCKTYEGEKMAPALTDISPEALVALISKKTQSRIERGSGGNNNAPNDVKDPEDVPFKTKRITQLIQILKTGLYDENPFDTTSMESEYRYIDFVVFRKWAKYVWKNSLVDIKARIVHARWIGSFNFDPATSEQIVVMMKENKELWLSIFWHDRTTGENRFIRFCLDLSECYGEVIRKLFQGGRRSNGSFNEFIPKSDGSPLDVLVAAVFAMMGKAECSERCPLYPNRCQRCLGGYWCKINSSKQILIFIANPQTENKDKKGYGKNSNSSSFTKD